MNCYALYAKDICIRKMGSSGGVFPAISEQFIKKDGIVYASVYNDDFSVGFERIDELSRLRAAFTSKYMQSDSTGIYEKVEDDLRNKRNVLFCGTPCQVKGLKNFIELRNIESNKLFTIDFICHGVPSYYLFSYFLRSYTQKKLVYLNMRSKDSGWSWYQYSWQFVFEDGSSEVIKQTDIPFMTAFSSNEFLRPSCYNCKSKKASVADITIGDFWGISDTGIKLNDRFGVSCLITNSSIGDREFQKYIDLFEYWDVEIKDIVKYNDGLKNSPQKSFKRNSAYKKIKKHTDTLHTISKITDYSVFEKAFRKFYQKLPLQKSNLNVIAKRERHLRYLHKKREDCCGCMACISACPKRAIETRIDFEGFAYPVIDIEICINCNICKKVCPYC